MSLCINENINIFRKTLLKPSANLSNLDYIGSCKFWKISFQMRILLKKTVLQNDPYVEGNIGCKTWSSFLPPWPKMKRQFIYVIYSWQDNTAWLFVPAARFGNKKLQLPIPCLGIGIGKKKSYQLKLSINIWTLTFPYHPKPCSLLSSICPSIAYAILTYPGSRTFIFLPLQLFYQAAMCSLRIYIWERVYSIT